MKVDPASGWPLSAQLAQALRELIRAGQLRPGDKVPSEPQLAREHQVSRDTAQRVLAMLGSGAGRRRARLARAALSGGSGSGGGPGTV